MPLKAFHIFFIILSSLLCDGLGALQFLKFQETGETVHLLGAAAGLISGTGLVLYLVWFLKKNKTQS